MGRSTRAKLKLIHFKFDRFNLLIRKQLKKIWKKETYICFVLLLLLYTVSVSYFILFSYNETEHGMTPKNDRFIEKGDTAYSEAQKNMPSGGISNLALIGYKPHPRTVGYYFDSANDNNGVSLIGFQSLITNLQTLPSKRHQSKNGVDYDRNRQRGLANSKRYWQTSADYREEGDCVHQHDWQITTYDSCSIIHEVSLGTELVANHALVINSGYWRDVWKVEINKNNGDGSRNNNDRTFALKTMRYEHAYTERNYDRHRRDHGATEHLTKSPYVVSNFGACGNTALTEFAHNGDLDSIIWEWDYSSREMLLVAFQVASGMADLHGIDGEGLPSIAHTDIKTSQFIEIDGIFKLNDFNRCRFLNKNKKTNEICSYTVGNNPGSLRAPEEYEYGNQTEKIDIYSMGNVFFYLLTKVWPFQHLDSSDAQKEIIEGKRPKLSNKLKASKDESKIALIKALKMCWVHDPKKRATAREIQKKLLLTLDKVWPANNTRIFRVH